VHASLIRKQVSTISNPTIWPSAWRKYVFIALEGSAEAVPAGRLVLYEEGVKPVGAAFVYGNKYLQRANALAVDPVSMPLDEARKHRETVFQPPAGLALFGAVRDATPDSWGRRVIENMLKVAPDSLPETGYLAHAGPHRTGALDFRDSPTSSAEAGKLPDIKELSYLLDAAALIQQGRRVPRNLQSLFSVGATLGGAWPKAVLLDGGRQWVAKFPAFRDSFNVPVIERATLELARLCGLRVPATRLVHLPDGRDVMLIERFDRVPLPKGEFGKRHVVSALTMLKMHEFDTGSAEYANLADTLGELGASGSVGADKTELFKRMVFNILVTNDDDHLRNHAFVWDGAHRGWRLSDLYDVVPKPQLGSERFLVLGVGPAMGRLATLDNALSAAGRFGLMKHAAAQIIKELSAIVREWRMHFDALGVPAAECEKVASAFRKPKDIGLRAVEKA
jgi:serine/threonine-protein kinase HipA